ncbi:MAG: MFS transporter [Thermoanaerobaculales bacterium]|jgi:1-acyl-sn-glycerol-3-phosphate acyltransferase|nr:MFS transporter [Thermoanaerobaculales bacterium]
MSQVRLLSERRFWPLFWTQFLGAFNDNLFKNALVILVAYRSMSLLGIDSKHIVVACAGIFILPFFLFSATAGQLADRFAKWRLIRLVKIWEIGAMTLAGIGFAFDNLVLLLVVLFLMGMQSAFFGPAKYSILPELLGTRDLVGGNALVAGATFLAILLGTITGGLVIAGGDVWVSRLGLMVVAVAGAGYLTSRFIQKTPPANPGLDFKINPVIPTIEILEVTRSVKTVFLSVLAISWFWFLGASFLSLLPNFSKDVMFGDETVVTLFLSTFCVGIGIGSMLCETFSRKRLELGLVPLGSIGMSVFAVDLAIAGGRFLGPLDGHLMGIPEYLGHPGAFRVLVDLFGIAVSAGFYTVPLMSFIQLRTRAARRSRVIAGLNIINSFFMVVSSVALVAALAWGRTIQSLFFILGVLNAAVAVYIYTVIPEFLLRFVAWCTSNVLYRLRVTGEEHIPAEGPAVLVANHVSWVDWLIVASVSARPVRFVMTHEYAELPLARFLMRGAKVIQIASAKVDPDLQQRAMDQIAAELDNGELVFLFPEGRLTPDGELQCFRPGIERIVERTPVPVVPMALVGLWGSFFSRYGGKAMTKPFRRVWSRVEIRIGEPRQPEDVTAERLAETVAHLGGWDIPVSSDMSEDETEEDSTGADGSSAAVDRS